MVRGFRGPCLTKSGPQPFSLPKDGFLADEVSVVMPTVSRPPHFTPPPSDPPHAGPTVLFDATHGQANWSQTGYASREMHSNFAGVTQALCRLGCTCASANERPLGRLLAQAKLLVVPPPTGRYHARKECWQAQSASLFTPEEIQDILAFLRQGGRLLAFAYRFGDSFTQTNLRDLFTPLGCLLGDDVILDLPTLRTTPPLQACFDTTADLLPLAWFRPGVERVRWRAMATFTLLPGATAQPIALSPGGRCIAFDRTHRRLRFDSRPIAVAGLHHQGRFALLGGPHAFETGPFGLLGEANNARFLQNVLQWLLADDPAEGQSLRLTLAQPLHWHPLTSADEEMQFGQVECHGRGQPAIAAVERLLRKTGVLKALARPRWQP